MEEYRREVCNDAGLGEVVAKYGIVVFCGTSESSLGGVGIYVKLFVIVGAWFPRPLPRQIESLKPDRLSQL